MTTADTAHKLYLELGEYLKNNGYESEPLDLLFANLEAHGEEFARQELETLISDDSPLEDHLKQYLIEAETVLHDTIASEDQGQLWDLWRDTQSMHHESVSFNLPLNPNCPGQILEQLVSKEPDQIEVIAEHENLTSRAALDIIKVRPDLTNLIAENPAMGYGVLNQIATTSNDVDVLDHLMWVSLHHEKLQEDMVNRVEPLPQKIQDQFLEFDLDNPTELRHLEALLSRPWVNAPKAVEALFSQPPLEYYPQLLQEIVDNPAFSDGQILLLARYSFHNDLDKVDWPKERLDFLKTNSDGLVKEKVAELKPVATRNMNQPAGPVKAKYVAPPQQPNSGHNRIGY